MNPAVTIILLNWNGADDTIECLQSLQHIDYKNFNVVVCDNASTDDSINKLCAWMQQNELAATLDEVSVSNGFELGSLPVAIIQTGGNLGFAGGNNVGIMHAIKEGAEYVLLLNNDTVVEPTFLTHLVDAALKDDSIGIVGGRIQYFNQAIRNHVWFGPAKLSLIRGIATADCKGEGVFASREVTFITGCLMLIRRDVLEKVGYLSDEYFMNVEDWEYCYRVARSGYKLYYTDSAVIYHKVSASSGGELSPFVLFQTFKNRVRFIKNLHWFYRCTSWLYLIGSAIFNVVKYGIMGKHNHAMAVGRGLLSGLFT